ncbi:MAG: hypothetical protein HFG43_02450 [Lachnospiraceae bacterium]|nr:hypothetical protein [Lachnospiraceae bacterium]
MSNRKKLCSLVSLVLMFTLSVTAYAAETNVPSGNFEISTAEVNGEEVELVVLKSKALTRSADNVVIDKETVFIPDFNEMTKEEHMENISLAKSRAIDPYQFAENNKYIQFNSELAYNTERYLLEGQVLDLVDLISFKIDRTIHTNAPFNSFHNPTVVAKQIGPVRGSGWGVLEQIYGQEKTYSNVTYGSRYDIPSDWMPVLPGVVGYKVGVNYRIKIDYLSGKDYTIEKWHEVR